jgi:hypothetical protein
MNSINPNCPQSLECIASGIERARAMLKVDFSSNVTERKLTQAARVPLILWIRAARKLLKTTTGDR